MASVHPPHLEGALGHLRESLQQVGGGDLDLAQASWADIEKSVARVLGGPFVEAQPEHQAVALGLATLLAERLMANHPAFWFPNRESPEGAMLGFAEALIVLSPYAAVADALSRSQLPALEQTVTQIRTGLGQAKFGPQSAGAAPPRLGAMDYARLFDPGFVQLLLLDVEKAKAAWDSPPEKLVRDLRDALGRLGDQLPAQARSQLEGQLVGSLSRMAPGTPLRQQADGAARLLELIGQLFGTTEVSGAAPEEFWGEVVFPLAFIGAPTQFAPLDPDEVAAIKQNADLLALWLDRVPFQVPAPEEGILGAFDAAKASLPAPEMAQAGAPRLIQVDPGQLLTALGAFHGKQVEEAMKRFTEGAAAQAGQPPKMAPDSQQMFQAATSLLEDTRRLAAGIVPGKIVLCLRHLTEAEAASESTWALLRKTLNGPRLILATR